MCNLWLICYAGATPTLAIAENVLEEFDPATGGGISRGHRGLRSDVQTDSPKQRLARVHDVAMDDNHAGMPVFCWHTLVTQHIYCFKSIAYIFFVMLASAPVALPRTSKYVLPIRFILLNI